METTFQFEKQSVLDHGYLVHDSFLKIVDCLENNKNTFELPAKLKQNWSSLKHFLYDLDTIKQYHVYHDCGKPFCRVVVDGKQRFPDHPIHSYNTYLNVFKLNKQNELVAKLIYQDMVFHSESSDNINNFIQSNDPSFIFTLWLTALAEIYANKQMFDADNQLSFKIKYKKLTSSLNKVCCKLLNEKCIKL